MGIKYKPESACSTTSLQAGENLAASAAYTRTWLLLEYDGPWESKALEGSQLPDEVKMRLIDVQKSLQAPRFLFIKGRPRKPEQPIHFYLMQSNEDQPAMYRIHLERYEDLLDLNIPAVLAGEPRYQPQLSKEPFFTVCVNALRDPCCAHFGVPLFHKMVKIQDQSQADWRVWQSTHVAGHRFAPNVLYFPGGFYFGRISPDQAENFIHSSLDGRLFLGNYRGRAEYAEPVQAAEIYLRQFTGKREMEVFHLTGSVNLADGLWSIHFLDRASGERYRLEVWQQAGGGRVLQSCGQENPPPTTFYQLAHLEMEAK